MTFVGHKSLITIVIGIKTTEPAAEPLKSRVNLEGTRELGVVIGESRSSEVRRPVNHSSSTPRQPRCLIRKNTLFTAELASYNTLNSGVPGHLQIPKTSHRKKTRTSTEKVTRAFHRASVKLDS